LIAKVVLTFLVTSGILYLLMEGFKSASWIQRWNAAKGFGKFAVFVLFSAVVTSGVLFVLNFN